MKIAPSFPLKLAFCDFYRNKFDSYLNASGSRSNIPSELKNYLAGGFAGLTVNTIIYPLDVVRGRLSCQQFVDKSKKYKNIRSCFKTMVIIYERFLVDFILNSYSLCIV